MIIWAIGGKFKWRNGSVEDAKRKKRTTVKERRIGKIKNHTG